MQLRLGEGGVAPKAFPFGEGGPSDEGRACRDRPQTGNSGKAAPHQSAGGAADSFSLRAKSRLRRLHSDTRLRAQPLGGSHSNRTNQQHEVSIYTISSSLARACPGVPAHGNFRGMTRKFLCREGGGRLLRHVQGQQRHCPRRVRRGPRQPDGQAQRRGQPPDAALAKELDFAYAQCGSLVVCLSEEDRPALQKSSMKTVSPTALRGCASSSGTSWWEWSRTSPGRRRRRTVGAHGRHRLPVRSDVCVGGERRQKTVCSFGLTPKLRACTRWTTAEPGGPSRPTTARWKHAASSMRRAYTPTRCTIWPTRRTP